MSSITADGTSGIAAGADSAVGPLEQEHLKNANYRAVATSGDKLTPTHWHIAIANGLGWGFDGMDGVIFALISPLVIKEFALTVPEYRSGLQIALFFGIAGLYFWPWLSDRLGRRTLLAVNIAYERKDKRSFVKKRIVALKMAAVISVAFALVAVLTILGPVVEHAIATRIGPAGGVLNIAWWIAQWPILLAGLLVAFATLLYLGPDVAHPDASR